jgi:hypothetical protein
MKLRARVAAIVLFTFSASLTTLTTTTALAGPATARPLKEVLKDDALAAFEHGTAYYSKKQYSEARADFEQAYALSKEPRVLYNVAICEKALAQYTRAAARLNESLKVGGDSLAEDYVALVRRTLELLDPYIGALSIDVSEAGSTVYVDGESIGTSPLPAAVSVDVGEHIVSAKHEGFVDATQKVDLPRAGARVRLSLAPMATAQPPKTRGTLRVLLDDATGTILVDGVTRGTGEASTELPAGEHRVRVIREGKAVYSSDVLIAPGESKMLSIQIASRGESNTRWFFLAGGAALVTAGVIVTVAIATSKTQYKGNEQGTLQPGFATASAPALFRF